MISAALGPYGRERKGVNKSWCKIASGMAGLSGSLFFSGLLLALNYTAKRFSLKVGTRRNREGL